MSHTDAARTANLLGSIGLAISDRMHTATEAAAGLGRSGPAALAALTTQLDGESIGALARSLAITHSAAVRLVDRLEQLGFVERRRGPDRRSVSVTVTARGRKTARGILDAREAAVGGVLGSLSVSEQHALAKLCEKLLDGLPRNRGDARRICRLCDPVLCGHDEGRCPVTEAANRVAEARAQ
jgi:MarR family transcriptional repressor of emrRAB